MPTVSLTEDRLAALEWRRYEKVKALYALRDSRYATLLQLLGGNFYRNDLITTQSISTDQASEIAQTTGKQLVVNRLAVVVRNYKNFLSQPPEIDVPPRRGKDSVVSAKDERHADNNEKLLYATWGANEMELQLQGITHYTCGLGSSPIKLWPDVKNRLIRYNILKPWTFYPMTRGSDFRRYRYV